jgi:hypothetical protein
MSKSCSTCKITKALSEYTKDKKRKDGLNGNCKSCRAIEKKKFYRANKEKVLIQCKEYYSSHAKEKYVYGKKWRKENKKAFYAMHKKWRDKNPDKLRNLRLKKFNLSLEEYNVMLLSQRGVCKICGKTQTKRSLAVDHDHKTGKNRGLLCTQCNLGIGYFEDNFLLLEESIKYLRSYGKV